MKVRNASMPVRVPGRHGKRGHFLSTLREKFVSLKADG